MNERAEGTRDPGEQRRLELALAALAGLAVAGFVVGVNAGAGDARVTGAVPEHAAMPAEVVAKAHGVTPAQPYKALAGMRRGVNAAWKSDVKLLAPELSDRTQGPKTPASAAAVKQAVAERAERRAYDGAPPVVPHPVQQRGGLACLSCHAKGAVLGEGIERRVASAISHPELTNCTQCHVEQANAQWGPQHWPEASASTFVGKASPTEGPRAYPDAPPQMPHSAHMRERCSSCHGPTGPEGLRTSHFERQSCQQCHTASADDDQRAVPGFGARFPVGAGTPPWPAPQR